MLKTIEIGETFKVKDGYRLMGFQYEFTANAYSLGRIAKCKLAMLDSLKPGKRLLIAGPGHGIEAIQAGKKGIKVTAVDISKTMLKHMQKKVDLAQLRNQVTLVNDNILNFKKDDQGYDMVMANYFLNVFSIEKANTILSHLISLIKPGGYMVIGDFAFPEKGGLLYKALQHSYHYFGAIIYWLTTDNEIHPIFDYKSMLESNGLEIDEIKDFDIFGWVCHRSIRAKKKDSGTVEKS